MSAVPQTREQYSAHIPALHLLCNLGWNFLTTAQCLSMRGSNREVLLKQRLIEVLQTRRFDYKGEKYPLSPSAIDQILREVSALNLAEGLMPANERLYAKLALGITVTEFMPDGKRHQPTIHVIDWAHPEANRWDVTEEMEVLSAPGTHVRVPDIVAFVNGIPLVLTEAKRPESTHGSEAGKAMVLEGISQHLRNQRPDEIPHLFACAQLLLSISQIDGRYGTTHTAAKFWARWREEEFDEEHFTALKNRRLPAAVRDALFAGKPEKLRAYFDTLWSQPMLPTDQDRLLIGLLTPTRLLELLRTFVLFDRKVGKIVARYQQFFGIRALIKRIGQFRPDGGREGGVIWHTTGSGKSFTMVFLSKALLLHEGLRECRVVVVTDRIDLEDQLSRNFISGGAFGSAIATKKEGERSKVTTGRELAERISHGAERILFTLVHKFSTATKLANCRNDSPNLIVLVDEGHRSHGGETHERMRKALPRAAYVAFTGTPLLKNEKAANKFGPIVHAYTMQRAVEDETVLPLLYEERVPELDINEAAVDRWFEKITVGLSDAQKADLKKKYARKGAVYGAVNRIELIAWDIATHFSENIKKLGAGLKGQVATDSKLSAIRYKQALDETELVTSAVVISPPDTREGNTEVDEDKLPEVQKWWKQNVGKDAEGYEKQILREFESDGDPDLLIVVDKLLTGFDEPRNTVLYIDKKLEGHNIIQAVARVNRLHDAKRYGVLVDYRGVLKALDTAIRDYRDLADQTQGGFDIADIDRLYSQFSTEYKRLPALHDELWSFFKNVANRQDMEQYRQVLMPRFVTGPDGESHDERQKLRDDFSAALTAFGLCLQMALSSRSFFEDKSFGEAQITQYKEDLRFFTSLRKVARQDALETVNYTTYEEQIRRLVDKQVIGREVREPKGVYLVHQLGGKEEAENWSEEKTRNETDLIRTRVRKTIEQELADDPYAQKVFSELLKLAIAEAEAMFNHPVKQYALFRNFEARLDSRDKLGVPGIPDAFSGNRHARAYYGAIRLVLGDDAFSTLDELAQRHYVEEAIALDRIVRDAIAENSLNPQSIETAIRKGVLPRLYKRMGLDNAKAVIEQIVQITRVRLSRA
ncbi:MAG: type I restriction endonuclease subunit R [Burkholderiales bacterium]